MSAHIVHRILLAAGSAAVAASAISGPITWQAALSIVGSFFLALGRIDLASGDGVKTKSDGAE